MASKQPLDSLENRLTGLSIHEDRGALSEQPSPGTSRSVTSNSRSKSFNDPEHRKKMEAKIRNLIRPYATSDPGLSHADLKKADHDLLKQLVLKGWDEVINDCYYTITGLKSFLSLLQKRAASALVACDNSSVEEALDVLTIWNMSHGSSKLPSISEKGLEVPAVAIAMTTREHPSGSQCSIAVQTDTTGDDQLRGRDHSAHRSPAFMRHASSRTPPPPELSDYDSRTPTPSTPFEHCQMSPISPFIHASPPPPIEDRNYSPISDPYSTRRFTPPTYAMDYFNDGTLRIRAPNRNPDSDSGLEEEPVIRRPICSPEACKFYIEQHMENVLKAHQQRQQRRLRLEQEMAKRGLDEVTSEQMRRTLAQQETNYLRLKRAKMDKSMFETVTTLGIGAFGTVDLVLKKDTGVPYAMKTLRKVDVLKKNQVAHVKAERDILAEADNEWVVKLFFSFKDKENLYFVMEYIPGGDMMSLLIKLGTFPRHLALFYTAELVCAIESVHRMGFIHRDIKPDNILIDANGHIKLTDFGLCTGFRWTHQSRTYQPDNGSHHQQQNSMDLTDSVMEHCSCHTGDNCRSTHSNHYKNSKRRVADHRRCIAHSLVGTPNYIACEVLRRQGYTQMCDWWSVGVILYEMLVGHPPFFAQSPAETQTKIINWPHYLNIAPQARARIQSEACDLIIRLICNPEERLGRNGAEEIKGHPFFNDIDWEVGIRNYAPPYIPKIMHDLDTSHFDQFPQPQIQSRKVTDPNMVVEGPDYAFHDWTFRRFWLEERSQNQSRRQISSHPPPPPGPPPVQPPGPANHTPAQTQTSKTSKSKPQPIYV